MNSKMNGVNGVNGVKSENKIDVPLQMVTGSTLPLYVESQDNNDYNPFEHRKVPHATT